MALQDSVLAHPLDWDATAAELSAASGVALTASNCLSRFLEMGIDWKPTIVKQEKPQVIFSIISKFLGFYCVIS